MSARATTLARGIARIALASAVAASAALVAAPAGAHPAGGPGQPGGPGASQGPGPGGGPGGGPGSNPGPANPGPGPAHPGSAHPGPAHPGPGHGPGHPGPGDPAACGMTISASYTLRSDLSCPGGVAITIDTITATAPIVLDLGGRTLSGSGSGTGILVDSQYFKGQDVVIRNGSLRGFQTAIAGNGSSNLALKHLTFTGNGTWLDKGPHYAQVFDAEHLTVVDSGYGGAFLESFFTVRRSHFVRSGIHSDAQSYTYVYDSTFVEGGVRTGQVSNLVAERNTFLRCDTGIVMVDSWPAAPSLLRGNRFVGCQTGADVGVVVAGSGANGVEISGNHFVDNAGDGLRFTIHTAWGDVSVVGNHANGNGGDGITGTGSGATLVARNHARGNGGNGIDVANVLDGGRNVAHGNLTEPQCVGVTCADH